MRKSTAACLLAFGMVFPSLVLAQTYPTRPIRLIVPMPPGGGIDFVGRVVAQRISDRLGQQIVVDNRAGANGINGLHALAQAAPDGYTIGFGSLGPVAVNPSMYKNLPYDPMRDFTFIATANDFPLLLLTHQSLPVKNMKDLIALAKAKPGQLRFSTSGTGNADHLASELFRLMAKINIVHIPYKGAAPSAIALLSGETQMMFNSIPPVLPHVRSGKMRALGVGSRERVPMLTDIPTVSEAGLPGYEGYSWGGIIGPAKLPADIVQKLNYEVADALKQKDVADRLLGNGCVPRSSTPEQFEALTRSEMKKWGDLVKSANITAD